MLVGNVASNGVNGSKRECRALYKPVLALRHQRKIKNNNFMGNTPTQGKKKIGKEKINALGVLNYQLQGRVQYKKIANKQILQYGNW